MGGEDEEERLDTCQGLHHVGPWPFWELCSHTFQQVNTSSCMENSLKGAKLGDHCNNTGLYQSGGESGGGVGEKVSDPGHISEGEPVRFSDGLDVGSERKRGVRTTLKFQCD